MDIFEQNSLEIFHQSYNILYTTYDKKVKVINNIF